MSDLTHPQRTTLPILKSLAITTSLWNAGTLTTAYRLLPSLYPLVPTAPNAALKQWEYYYWALSRTVPVTDLATILICSRLAYHDHSTLAPSWKLWASAVGLMPVGWVWVWTRMLGPSNELLAISNGTAGHSGEKEEGRVLELLKEFNSLMSVRMVFPWVVGGLGLLASLG